VAASASGPLGCGLVALLALAVLPGCDSTQSKNERAKLRATRELARREPQRVTRVHPDVRVDHVALVRGGRSSAVVVELRSRASEPLTDVPIAVGVRTPRGRRVALNERRNLDWFQTHVPAIPAGGRVTWVFEGRRPARPGERAFARVGAPATPAISHARELPRVDAAPAVPVEGRAPAIRSAASGRADAVTRAGVSRGRVAVRVRNASDVPQYGLQVYAVVRDRGRYVAAGRTSLEHLGTGQGKTATVRLIGAAGRRPPRVHAIPTVFR
jgi:hypothetical protein